ncbi:hypothetical protein [Virgibacillus salexigens]|uniref:Uncharacterized protein n=1 Tax=Virgibacillus kapii TaxID=1638645 RepID=A0ABQ2DKV3_9BACI|nr:hypothetical protein [Virgibacillus kapii]GGJ62023.1 hypothetical protein GCM10007111_25160 [Virgibacillus kapii]
MAQFKATVTESVPAHRLLSIGDGESVVAIGLTAAGEQPDFYSTRNIEANEEVYVTIKGEIVWEIEAGEDLSIGQFVEAGEGGVVVASAGEGIGYVAEPVATGSIAKVIKQSTAGVPGPQGDTGSKGAKGDPGVSVTEITSDGTNLTFTLSDGTTQDIPWPAQ